MPTNSKYFRRCFFYSKTVPYTSGCSLTLSPVVLDFHISIREFGQRLLLHLCLVLYLLLSTLIMITFIAFPTILNITIVLLICSCVLLFPRLCSFSQGCGSAFISSGSGSSILGSIRIRIPGFNDQKLKKNYSWKIFFLLIKNYNLSIPKLPWRMFKLQKKPSILKRGHPTLQNMNF